jgi:hypothetical protein
VSTRDPFESLPSERPASAAPDVPRPARDTEAERAGFLGPPLVINEADDTGLAAFETEWKGDSAEETAAEADAHQPFDHEPIAIEQVEPEYEQPEDSRRRVTPKRSTPRWIFAAARAAAVFALGSLALHYSQELNRPKTAASPAAPKAASIPKPAPIPSTRAVPAPPDLVRPSARRDGGQSAPSADSRPAAAPIPSSFAKASEDKSSFAKAKEGRSSVAKATEDSAVVTTRPSPQQPQRSPTAAVARRPPVELAVAPAVEPRAPVAPPIAEPEPPATASNDAAPPSFEPLNIRETELTQHRIAIRELLDAYRESYDRLDAVSAARLWPGVDTAALSRAFSTLSSQDVEFDSCTLDLDRGLPAGAHYQQATALCSGSVTYVRRVGNTSPQSKVMAWTFLLDRSSGRWLIRRVMAK